MAEGLQPISARERLLVLDVLRGGALFGVLLGNLHHLYTGRWLLELTGDEPSAHGLDAAAEWFMTLFVNSRAQTLLTFLFGFGFAIQLLRADARGEPVLPIYLRRLIVLFCVGWLHLTLLWWGDVTWGYAIAGFALLPFRGVSNRARVIWAAVFLVAAQLSSLLPWAHALPDLLFGPHAFQRINDHTRIEIYGHDYLGLMHAQFDQGVLWTVMSVGWYFPWMISRFLLGYAAGIAGWFERDGAGHLGFWKKVLGWGLLLTLLGWTLTFLAHSGVLRGDRIGRWGSLGIELFWDVALVAQVGAYIAAVVLLVQRPWWRRVLGVIAPAGRMPLTTYITQSVVCTFIFYAWGLGRDMPDHLGSLGVAAVIFTAQIAIAHVWLRYFRFGPLEWVWRALVYLRRPPMRV